MIGGDITGYCLISHAPPRSPPRAPAHPRPSPRGNGTAHEGRATDVGRTRARGACRGPTPGLWRGPPGYFLGENRSPGLCIPILAYAATSCSCTDLGRLPHCWPIA